VLVEALKLIAPCGIQRLYGEILQSGRAGELGV